MRLSGMQHASTSRVQAHTDRPMVRLVLPPPQHSLRHMRGCPVWLPGMQAEVRWAEQAYRSRQEVMVVTQVVLAEVGGGTVTSACMGYWRRGDTQVTRPPGRSRRNRV